MEKDKQANKQEFPWEQQRGGLTGHWVKRAYIAMRRQLEAQLRELGLTHSQWAALGYLYYRKVLTHSELEEALFIEAPSLTSLIKGMEKRGWVKRRQHPDDARVKQIFITELGIKAIEPALNLGIEGEEKLRELIPEEELEQLKETLRKIVRHFE
jgi:MarR family transcriptional regulator for hemolysin